MNPWILAGLVACFVGAWIPAIHAQGAFEDCCLDYHSRPTLLVLRHARYYRVQEVSGSCNLPAVIFHFRHSGRMVCGNPRDRRVQKAIRFLDARLKASPKSSNNTQMPFQGFQHGKKSNSGISRLPPLFKLKDHSSSRGKRNAFLS